MRSGGMSSIVGQRKYIRVCAGRRHGLLSGISAICFSCAHVNYMRGV